MGRDSGGKPLPPRAALSQALPRSIEIRLPRVGSTGSRLKQEASDGSGASAALASCRGLADLGSGDGRLAV